ncbi:hypothetical protein C7H19_24015 [Aphanothece hegewaldii CCALA 016]|uniref:Uncharacterized protein n=1 Tax=Aphanothece hegewaldii CCALA 016 TaxID=2107694 RepID=A0A2T1LQV2_9CHRO|nr:DUF6753 family protein [Aphanothece hegewaldii]PSF30074.1 hypothetical protein C7H19_24015 [Aphanothece hegewaldii CCALA 016]
MEAETRPDVLSAVDEEEIQKLISLIAQSDDDVLIAPEIADYNDLCLHDVLKHKTPQERQDLIDYLLRSNVTRNDPLFGVLVCFGDLQLAPKKLNRLFRVWAQRWQDGIIVAKGVFEAHINRLETLTQEHDKLLKSQSKTSMDLQASDIAATVNTLVKQASLTKVSHDIYALIASGAILLGAVGIGIVLGLSVPLFRSPVPLDPSKPRVLTLEEKMAMQWGLSDTGRWVRSNPEQVRWLRSPEGRFAQSFTTWNQTLLSFRKGQRLCIEDQKKLGITLSVEGRLVRSGTCTLWVVPPEKRQFVDSR